MHPINSALKCLIAIYHIIIDAGVLKVVFYIALTIAILLILFISGILSESAAELFFR